MNHQSVPVVTHTTTTLHVNFDMPDELRAALEQFAYAQNGDAQVAEVIVTIAGVRVGRVNMFSRAWERSGAISR